MNEGYELVQFGLRGVSDTRSALSVWSRQFPRIEPSFVETDEDGDTRAGGGFGELWLEILHQKHRVDFFVLGDDPSSSARQEVALFGVDNGVFTEIEKLACSAAETYECKAIDVLALHTRIADDREGVVEVARSVLKHVPIATSVGEIELRLRGTYAASTADDYPYLQEVNWRTGERSTSLIRGDPSDVKGPYVFALGCDISLKTMKRDDPLPANHIEPLLSELFAKVRSIVNEATDAF